MVQNGKFTYFLIFSILFGDKEFYFVMNLLTSAIANKNKLKDLPKVISADSETRCKSH